jgi:aspartate--ammonia ligase
MEYQSALSLIETEVAIKFIKDTFEKELAKALKLTRVSAPLFVQPESGLNDNLNGFERAVRFDVLCLKKEVEIVQSLAKWKRMALAKYGFEAETGLYTDMNAIRRDEDLDALHSVYVDQWDWEKIITKQERTLSYLKKTVRSIYGALKKLASAVNKKYPQITHTIPDKITFISTRELERKYPTLNRKEREKAAAKEYGAIFLYQIGYPLKDGAPHDGRAADYDDWKLNGDIILWYDVLGIAMEISSMGIRVDKDSLVKQLKAKKEMFKLDNPYCQDVINDRLPLTIGGGIGQSRLCMFFLNKAHIGEVQSSIWSEESIQEYSKKGIKLL